MKMIIGFGLAKRETELWLNAEMAFEGKNSILSKFLKLQVFFLSPCLDGNNFYSF